MQLKFVHDLILTIKLVPIPHAPDPPPQHLLHNRRHRRHPGCPINELPVLTKAEFQTVRTAAARCLRKEETRERDPVGEEEREWSGVEWSAGDVGCDEEVVGFLSGSGGAPPHQIWIGGVSKQKPHHHRIRRAVALQCGRRGGGRSGGRPVDGRPVAGGRPTGAGRGRGRAWMGREEGTAAGRGERGGRPGGRKRDLRGRVSTGRIL
jgi:hypothetical protein